MNFRVEKTQLLEGRDCGCQVMGQVFCAYLLLVKHRMQCVLPITPSSCVAVPSSKALCVMFGDLEVG